MTTSIQTELPSELIAAAQQLVRDGWASDLNQIIADALPAIWTHTPSASRNPF